MRPDPDLATVAHRARAAARAVPLLAALALAWPTARAADAHAFGGLDASGVRGRLVLTDLRVPDPRLADDRFDVGVARLDGAARAALGWRRTAAAGPLGNLVLEATAGAALAAPAVPGAGGVRAGVEAAARGVLGPVALELRVAHGGRTPFTWPELALDAAAGAQAADPRRRTGAAEGSPATVARASVAWRIDRAWTLSAAPGVARTATGWSASVDAALRRAGVADALDLSLRLDAAWGAAGSHAMLGLTAHHVPRRAPESRATVWLGSGPAGAASWGVEGTWAVREGAGEAWVAVGWGPAWSDRPQAYAALRTSAPVGEARLRASLVWSEHGTTAEVGVSRPLGR